MLSSLEVHYFSASNSHWPGDPADAETAHTPQALRRSRRWLHESERSPVRLVMARPFHSLGRLTDWLPSALALHSHVEESISELKGGISCCLMVCLMVVKQCDKSPPRPLPCTVSQTSSLVFPPVLLAQQSAEAQYTGAPIQKVIVVRPRNRSDCRIGGVVHLNFPPRTHGGGATGGPHQWMVLEQKSGVASVGLAVQYGMN